jgi:hypothetical protein
MSISDFLFNGAPPASIKTYGVAATTQPAWYSDYTQGLIEKANSIAASPYQAYGLNRVAGFTPEQQKAFAGVDAAADSWKPAFNQAAQAINAAGSSTGLSAAQPYFNQASRTIPSGVSDYLNPYTENVVNRLGDLAKRQVSENLIPTVQGQFTAGGTFGGSRSGKALAQGLRDIQESTMAQQSAALERGYTQAGAQFTSDQNRLAQLGQASGALQTSDLNRYLDIARQQETLGGLQQQLGLTGLAAQEAVGGQQQMQNQANLDWAYKDFLAQRDRPQDMVSFLNQTLRGLEIPSRTSTENVAPAQVYQPSGLASLANAAVTATALSKIK